MNLLVCYRSIVTKSLDMKEDDIIYINHRLNYCGFHWSVSDLS